MTYSVGKIEQEIEKKIKKEPLHMTVLDPAKFDIDNFGEKGKIAEEQGTDIIAVGGTTNISQLDQKMQVLKKKIRCPLILFPSNVWSVSKYADAIFFIRLLNSRSSYFLCDAPILLAPLVRDAGIETIPTGYMLFEPGGSAGWISDAKLLSRKNTAIATSCALSGEYSGARFIFMEAGSGASSPIEGEIIEAVKKTISVPLIVGSGITTPEQAANAVKHGADIVDTSTIFEKTSNIREIIQSIKNAKRPSY